MHDVEASQFPCKKKKFKTTNPGKMMATDFSEMFGVISVDFIPSGATTIAGSYQGILSGLWTRTGGSLPQESWIRVTVSAVLAR
jgi:hypothetical protein